jgi:DNA-binding SARP family transcriptional activator
VQPTIRIHLFGVPNIQVNHQTGSDPPTQKARFLLYYLLLFNNNTHLRESLGALFWGEHSDSRARHSLSTELWRLRRWLAALYAESGALFSLRDGEVRLQLSDSWWLDLVEFERHLARAHQSEKTNPTQYAASLQQAVQLYRGDLLEGCYSDWCLVERERLRQAYLDALLKLLVHHGGKREYATAIEYGQRLLNADPLQEQVHRELMKLYVLNHQQPQALAQYQTCVRILQDELSIAPSVETQVIMRQAASGKIFPLSNNVAANNAPAEHVRVLAERVRTALLQIETARRELEDTLQALDEIQSSLAQK